ncbi:hypothetical protein BDV98DRAFT_402010 [Pterulicium gracile]|uniref:Xylanolytic transcriptional activator regulatory domain-containing protein n=1 Tax=Pterulicium gracile TaxID=1884261 RepID=A0A5C3Q084_9AGAR|nr:hypothetical protein BDV98DRAFT_402010 [Pterula gracilis]
MSWTMVGIGIRRAQAVGAHRWQTFGTEKAVERELWTRAWWCLVVMDWMATSAIGQPCISAGCRFDVDFSTECDDEFWEHSDPQTAWKQPEDSPSTVSFFVSHIKQTQILATVLEYQYVNHKTKQMYMIDQYRDFDRKVATEPDPALNKWMDSMPEHLHNRAHSQQTSLFHRQSIVLHAELYLLQILIHRLFLASSDQQSAMTASSVAVCTTAARACSHLFDAEDTGCLAVAYRVQWPAFFSAVVLILNIWSSKRIGHEGLCVRAMRNVKIGMLRHSESCWRSSGQLVDILHSLEPVSTLEPASSQPIIPHSVDLWSGSFGADSGHTCTPRPEEPSVFDDALPLNTGDLTSILTSINIAVPFPGFSTTVAQTLRSMNEEVPSQSLGSQPVFPHILDVSESPGPMPPNIFFDLDTLSIWTTAPARGLE